MFLVCISVAFITGGLILFYLTKLFPILQTVYLDWICLMLFIAPSIIIFYRIHVTRTWKHVDKLPLWKHLIDYMRRDNEVIPIIGERAYPGESFLDVKQLGLIEYLGKDCYYNWGDKKIMWGLENINYSPDPRYANFTHLLYTLGFSDSDDVINVLKGNDLELMGKVYLNMLEYDGKRGAGKLVKEMEKYDGKVVDFEPVKKYGDIVEFLDKKIRKKET